METGEQLKLLFHGVDFINVEFTSSRRFQDSDDTPISVDINPKVFFSTDNHNLFNIFMETEVSADGFFFMKVVGVGYFELDNELTPEVKDSFVNVNAPAIMFPYLRSFISNFTASIGTPTGTLTIPTQFFKGKLEIITD